MAVELGVLRGLVDALYAMNIADDQLVEFIEDDDSYHLETVDDDDFDIEVEREPRVWHAPFTPPPGVVVEDSYGTRWKWENGLRYAYYGGEWDSGIEATTSGWFPRHISTLTEVLS